MTTPPEKILTANSPTSSSPSNATNNAISPKRKIIYCILFVVTFLLGFIAGMGYVPILTSSSSSSSGFAPQPPSSPSNTKTTISRDQVLSNNAMLIAHRKHLNPKIAFVGYMDTVPNAVYEVKWMYFSALGSGVKGDILLMGHPNLRNVPNFCKLMKAGEEGTTLDGARQALEDQKCMKNGWPVASSSSSSSTTNETSSEEKPIHPCNVRCLVIANEKDDQEAVSLNYAFLRSLHFPNDPVVSALLEDYDYVLKTDLDVFFTPKFVTLRPPVGKIYGGRGAYVFYDEVAKRLKRIANDLKLKHRLQHNVGATWYGDAKTILQLTRLAREVTIHILKTEYKNGPGKWAGWWRGVSSMYGGEIAVNHLAPTYLKGELDMACNNGEKTCKGSLIHAWHQAEVFNKFDLPKYNATLTLDTAHGNLLGPDASEEDKKRKFTEYMSKSGNFALYVAMNVRLGNEVPPLGPWKRGICLK